jgi:hypothetical protein
VIGNNGNWADIDAHGPSPKVTLCVVLPERDSEAGLATVIISQESLFMETDGGEHQFTSLDELVDI